jgi:sec-independent protein translocase protein TatC
MGVLTPEMLKEYRKMALIGMAVLSAMFTPPEPVSMLVMLCPLYLLYELSILASHIVIRKKEQQELQ